MTPVVLALEPLQLKVLYTLVTDRIDQLVGDRKHSDLAFSDQLAHVVLGLIEEKLCDQLEVFA